MRTLAKKSVKWIKKGHLTFLAPIKLTELSSEIIAINCSKQSLFHSPNVHGLKQYTDEKLYIFRCEKDSSYVNAAITKLNLGLNFSHLVSTVAQLAGSLIKPPFTACKPRLISMYQLQKKDPLNWKLFSHEVKSTYSK